ncbi:N-acetylglutaminylglutamine synthetase [Blastococcus sp. MG754426]|uniref:N-acetylglutaminylglutamine synthetase n=1 Tax=unclassified Blastococcus TaxID=2619396 RepID=UPI001EF0374E|nr:MULTISPECIES: N-acetylglutaminylglutamine synthetase [unclassified Blastococcus]MCF6509753.1 N-acetylglutaminylglutamine synthetase [Blastococcus sp. MG754426]MCF6514145.1 N-acetylglutaminylglutamine synthetase [Blastococcus sp. MG754427]MCF6734844.1 N-acetylglutaminylglutamine synthetase [Blastococcus sp. KM273129]
MAPRLAGHRRRTAVTTTPAITSRSWKKPSEHQLKGMASDVVLDLGWGRLVFGQTFADLRGIVTALRAEETGERDICIYPRDPHVLVGLAPDELFIDPSYTFRLDLHRYRPRHDLIRGVFVRTVTSRAEMEAINDIYALNGMVVGDADVMWDNHRTRCFTYLVAEDTRTGKIVGTVTGVDHGLAFDDPEGGTSLWCLAVHNQDAPPGVGEALVRVLAERYVGRGRSYLDLSVMHDNEGAIKLYRKLGFSRVSAVCVKRKNPINTPLFAARPPGLERLNPYALIIAEEALRRGVRVEVTDPEWGEMRLSLGGRTVVTRESLSEFTTAVAMSRCDDKRVTRRIMERAGVRVARGALACEGQLDEAAALLRDVGQVVVKPARGEQGRGITVGVRDEDGLARAVDHALAFCPDVLVEELVPGQDLRVVVIDRAVVAAAVRRPAEVVGDGRNSVTDLVRSTSRRRERATGGESRIPLDGTTAEVVADAGYSMDDVPPNGERIQVRRTANLHTGGTIEDVTDRLHPEVAAAAVRAATALDIPVTGIDFLVPDVAGPDYVFIEANERPGLANHEPQPTAERFVDLLFPETQRRT